MRGCGRVNRTARSASPGLGRGLPSQIKMTIVHPGEELPNDDPNLDYFRDRGIRNLLTAMLRQSIQDLVVTIERPKAADSDQQISARWLSTPDAIGCISFLMPDVCPQVAVARIQENPRAVLDALDRKIPQGVDGNIESSNGDFYGLSSEIMSGIELEEDNQVHFCAPGFD